MLETFVLARSRGPRLFARPAFSGRGLGRRLPVPAGSASVFGATRDLRPETETQAQEAQAAVRSEADEPGSRRCAATKAISATRDRQGSRARRSWSHEVRKWLF